MRVDDFDFHLPDERIALEPARPREAARLLCVAPDGLDDRIVRDLPRFLKPGDVVVFNDTKVIPAQLTGARPARDAGGADISVDVTLHKRISAESWRAFVRPAKRLRAGDIIRFADKFSARVTAREGAEATLQFDCAGSVLDAAINEAGAPPLPPYIARRRDIRADDEADYQTTYAQEEGSVAAPTAGLHFTPALLEALKTTGAELVFITLHVGAGTFLPVTADDTRDHQMHAEWGEITAAQAAAINKARAGGGRLFAVGTTALRLLESAADKDGTIHPFTDETDIFITPGYRFKTADYLLTNFHLPRSTLFMLVCAFAGVEAMKTAYAHAIDKEYRFYSFGDASLLARAH